MEAPDRPLRVTYALFRLMAMSEVRFSWRGDFDSGEVNKLHANAFEHRVFEVSEWDWARLCADHSLGWVTAREDDQLVGFVNVLWDGLVHAWIQDQMVSSEHRRRGIGVGLIHAARDGAKAAGCEWLHVDFGDHLKAFYFGAAGFTPTNAGLIDLTQSE